MNTEHEQDHEGNALSGLKICAICWLVGIAAIGGIIGLILWVGSL